MASYSVAITMDQNTVEKLIAGGYKLYAFKAVQTAGTGVPTVWFKSTTFSLSTTIGWQVAYQAYTSRSQIVPNGQIVASANYGIDLGQTLKVTSAAGTGTVDVSAGVPGAISILNQTSTELVCGISQKTDPGDFGPMCAFPLYGNNLDVIAPIEKVFLMFASNPLNTGTVVFQSYGQGLMIDLTGATNRQVQYELNNGWTWGSASWATAYPPNANLVPLLIESSANLENDRLKRLGGVTPLFVPAESRGPAPVNDGQGEG